MYRKLLIYALITSPIIALYGISPFYIFDKIGLKDCFFIFNILTINVFLNWLINIFMVKKYSQLSNFKLYTISFLISLIIHIPKLLIEPELPFKNIIDQFLIYPAVTSIAIHIIIWVIINSIQVSEKKKIADSRIELLTIQNLEAQKQVLLQQLQPHFLFNALSTLKALISENVQNAEDYTIRLSEFLRYSLKANNNEIVDLLDELKFTEDYINLQKVRFGDALQVSIKISDEYLKRKVPVYSLQILVENAIKHNILTTKKILYIDVSIDNNRIKITNNKNPKALILNSGIGLKNLNLRYEIISNNKIEINETEKEFTVYINLIQDENNNY